MLAVLIALYLLLLVPAPAPQIPSDTNRLPFAWNRDAYWQDLEDRYRVAREVGSLELTARIDSGLAQLERLIDLLNQRRFAVEDSIFDRAEVTLFDFAPDVAACPRQFLTYLNAFNRLRQAVKKQSCHWDLQDSTVHRRLYRLLYGGRTAVEQIMLQMPRDSVPALTAQDDVSSTTPAARVLGVILHSGDILISRGGAPTSALIARGSDYPGNFSHAALVYIDSTTNQVSIIESHIEKGVTISSLDQYLKDTKLRIMVLRLRPDLPALQGEPLLPHQAARLELQRAQRAHLPYDFAMNSSDATKVFCSEVVLEAYRRVGIQLWKKLSHISSAGIRSWLAAFGVSHFDTQEPSDLEYDPQLQVVAEWRDPETLYKDQMDNAVVDVMLEGAEKGEVLQYTWYLLPVARVAKLYSVVLNWFGRVGSVPEGMPASAALRNKWFSAEHSRIKTQGLILADQFKQRHGFTPPYWELVKLAREAK